LENFLSYPLGKFKVKPPPPIGYPDPSTGGVPILNGMAHSKSWHISKGIIKTIMVDEIVLKTLLFFAVLFFKSSLYIQCNTSV
jgi:hypothetical protein